MKLSTVIAAFAAVIIFSTSAFAQGVSTAPLSQSADVVTELTFSASNASTTLSSKSIDLMSRHAISNETAKLATMIPQAANQLSAQVRTQYATLSNGGSKTFTSGVLKTGAVATNVLDQRSVTMKVTYEPRPIGGILSMTVSLVPTFAGIGGASRPAASRTMSMAVNEINDDAISTIISNMTNELSAN